LSATRLDERKRRKEFILQRGLLDVKRQQEMDSRRSKEERELYQEARVFLRYHSTEEHEALLGGLNAEREIRQQIAELQVGNDWVVIAIVRFDPKDIKTGNSFY
jgi:transcriptional adapter 2-alpha